MSRLPIERVWNAPLYGVNTHAYVGHNPQREKEATEVAYRFGYVLCMESKWEAIDGKKVVVEAKRVEAKRMQVL